MPQMNTATGTELTPTAQWVLNQTKLEALQSEFIAKKSNLEQLAVEITETIQSIMKFRPNLGTPADFNHSKPKRELDLSDGRPFAISTGRAIIEAKKKGKSREDAKKLALQRLHTLATNAFYNLTKAPQSAIDKVELQLQKYYGE